MWVFFFLYYEGTCLGFQRLSQGARDLCQTLSQLVQGNGAVAIRVLPQPLRENSLPYAHICKLSNKLAAEH